MYRTVLGSHVINKKRKAGKNINSISKVSKYNLEDVLEIVPLSS